MSNIRERISDLSEAAKPEYDLLIENATFRALHPQLTGSWIADETYFLKLKICTNKTKRERLTDIITRKRAELYMLESLLADLP